MESKTSGNHAQKKTPDHFTILPAIVRYDRNLTATAKIIFSEIKSLANTSGKCWASNAYLCELFHLDDSTISKSISMLKKFGYISTELIYKSGSKQVDQRIIRLTNKEFQKLGGTDLNQEVLNIIREGTDLNQGGTDLNQQVLIKSEGEYYNINNIIDNSISANSIRTSTLNLESEPVELISKQSEPVDDNKALGIVQSNIEVKTSTDKYSTNMRNSKYYKLIFKQNFTVSTIEDHYNDFSIEEKNILNEYYQTLKGRLKENYNKENYLYLQLMYSLFLSKDTEFTNLVLNNSSIDRMDLNVIDSLYEDYCSINKTPIVTNQNIIASNVAPCATDTSMMKDSNNSTDAHASGEISAPANGHTTTSRSTPSKIESLKMERKAIERHAKKVALELADQFFGEY